MAWRLWCKLNSLVYLDPSWWLGECARFARGLAPYKDFSWLYPPFSLALFGTAMKWFGIRFAVAQTLMDILSLAIVFLAYRILRYLLPRAYALGGCLLLIAVCGTSHTYFSLFSLLSYSPALQVTTVGLLLFSWGLLRYLEAGRFDPLTVVLLSGGATIALTSKPEPFAAIPAVLLLLALFDRRLWFRESSTARWMLSYSALFFACIAPAALIFAITGALEGFDNLRAGVSGYGLATASCAWWPTGLGLFAAAAAVGQGGLFVALFILQRPAVWRKYLGRLYPLFRVVLVAGVAAYAGYEYFLTIDDLRAPGSAMHKLIGFLTSVLATTELLRPFFWCSIAVVIGLTLKGLRRSGSLTRDQLTMLLLCAIPAAMGARSLFGESNTPYPNVTAICYVPLLLAIPCVLLRVFRLPDSGGRGAWIPIGGFMAVYIAIRLVGGYEPTLSDAGFGRLETLSGPVMVRDLPVSAGIYDYIVKNTRPGDSILEIPHGGGMTFASGRRNSVFGSLFIIMPVPERYRLLDVERMKQHPPEVIVAKDAPNYGSSHTTGQPNGCSIPRLVWMPKYNPEVDTPTPLPLVTYIEEHYRADRKIGPWLMLRPAR